MVGSCADKEGKVSIYDSSFDQTSDQVDVQLAQIYPQSAKFVYVRERMQQQEGATDCGLFAAAVCTSLALKRNPSNTRWEQPKMRDHLARACGIWYHNQCVGFSDNHQVVRGIAKLFKYTSCSMVE